MSLVLVTGGLGFIGSHTCISLLNNGLDVLIIDSLVNSCRDNYEKIKKVIGKFDNSQVGNISFLKGDLRNNEWLNSVFQKQISLNNPIDSVIHFLDYFTYHIYLQILKYHLLQHMNHFELQ